MNLAETETVNQSPLEPKGWANPGGIRFGDFHHPSRVLNLVILKVQTFADMDYTDYTDYTEYTDYTDYTQTEHLRRLSSQEALFFSSAERAIPGALCSRSWSGTGFSYPACQTHSWCTTNMKECHRNVELIEDRRTMSEEWRLNDDRSRLTS